MMWLLKGYKYFYASMDSKSCPSITSMYLEDIAK